MPKSYNRHKISPGVQKTDRETPTKLEEYELNTNFVSGFSALTWLWPDLERGQGLEDAYQPPGVHVLNQAKVVLNPETKLVFYSIQYFDRGPFFKSICISRHGRF